MKLEWYNEEDEILKITLKNGASEVVAIEDLLAEMLEVCGIEMILDYLGDLGLIEIEE